MHQSKAICGSVEYWHRREVVECSLPPSSQTKANIFKLRNMHVRKRFSLLTSFRQTLFSLGISLQAHLCSEHVAS